MATPRKFENCFPYLASRNPRPGQKTGQPKTLPFFCYGFQHEPANYINASVDHCYKVCLEKVCSFDDAKCQALGSGN